MDMVGRDDCDNLEGDYTNTLFVVGADRISTDLHNLIVKTNANMQKPLTLDYELNDPADPENVYTRSDHYSYAAKGIPIVFFTTGLHQDYHRVTDTVDKIVFPKMARIAQLVYESGFSIANSERKLERDNKGPRAGLGAKAEVLAEIALNCQLPTPEGAGRQLGRRRFTSRRRVFDPWFERLCLAVGSWTLGVDDR